MNKNSKRKNNQKENDDKKHNNYKSKVMMKMEKKNEKEI